MEYYEMESLYPKLIQLHTYDHHPSSKALHNLLLQVEKEEINIILLPPQGEFSKLHAPVYQEKDHFRFYLLLFQPIHQLIRLLNQLIK